MKLLESLRTHLLAAPLLINRDGRDSAPQKIQPDDLLTFAETGQIDFHHGGNDSFQLQYTATIIITDFAGDPNAVHYFMLQWIKQNYPVNNGKQYAFNADILSHDAVDLSIEIELSESINVTTSCDGITLTSCEQPDPNPDWISTDWKLTDTNGDTLIVAGCHPVGGEDRELYVNDELQ